LKFGTALLGRQPSKLSLSQLDVRSSSYLFEFQAAGPRLVLVEVDKLLMILDFHGPVLLWPKLLLEPVALPSDGKAKQSKQDGEITGEQFHCRDWPKITAPTTAKVTK
jgi:hypothetical protein